MLRGNTQGKAFPQCVFDHWEAIKGLPLTEEKARNLVLGIRKRKGLKEAIPDINDYLDKA
jgi:elongation factor 2